ncbi:rCG51053 [Rattus norvegicus]|uniref:RCG51053 n=1 Tax=Rattus norvegicus TaxID=10116 RepID=A6IYJ9_RAT|nr:rCG51053 [Rattus norvegicus]
MVAKPKRSGPKARFGTS